MQQNINDGPLENDADDSVRFLGNQNLIVNLEPITMTKIKEKLIEKAKTLLLSFETSVSDIFDKQVFDVAVKQVDKNDMDFSFCFECLRLMA